MNLKANLLKPHFFRMAGGVIDALGTGLDFDGTDGLRTEYVVSRWDAGQVRGRVHRTVPGLRRLDVQRADRHPAGRGGQRHVLRERQPDDHQVPGSRRRVDELPRCERQRRGSTPVAACTSGGTGPRLLARRDQEPRRERPDPGLRRDYTFTGKAKKHHGGGGDEKGKGEEVLPKGKEEVVPLPSRASSNAVHTAGCEPAARPVMGVRSRPPGPGSRRGRRAPALLPRFL